MSEVRLSNADAIDLFELLHLVNDWTSDDPIARSRPTRFINNSAWAPDAFITRLDRFAALLGASGRRNRLCNNMFC